MQPSEIAIPVLPSKFLPATLAFYARLGFVGKLLGINDSYAILTRGDLELHFFSHTGLNPAESHAGCYLRVADAACIYEAFASAELPTHGIPRMDSLADKIWGMKEFAIVDEDGNLLRIGQVL